MKSVCQCWTVVSTDTLVIGFQHRALKGLLCVEVNSRTVYTCTEKG